MPFFVYILRNPEGRLYVGQTSDLELRVCRHNEGRVRWIKSRGPRELLFSVTFTSRSASMTEERRLKAMKSKQALQDYVAQSVESRARLVGRINRLVAPMESGTAEPALALLARKLPVYQRSLCDPQPPMIV